MKRLFIVTGLILALIVMLISSVPVVAGQGQLNGPLVRIERSTSTNWSGYAEAASGNIGAIVGVAGSVTDVKGAWTVPGTTGPIGSNSGSYYSSAWVGIDGYGDSTVEQIGTEQDWSNGKASYYAWFEMYPSAGFELNPSIFSVAVGDSIAAEVTYVGNSKFNLSMSDTRGKKLIWSFSPTNYPQYAVQTLKSAKEMSAEWVMEAPSSRGGVLPLANFGTISFGNCSAMIKKYTCGITTDPYDAITMKTSKGTTEATPSGVTPSSSTPAQAFSVTWNSSGVANKTVSPYEHVHIH